MTCCTFCDTEVKRRFYTFNEADDDDNLYCPNESCVHYTDTAIFQGREYKIKYACNKCNRTLLYQNEEFFKNGDLIDGWLCLKEYTREGEDCPDACDDCEEMVLELNHYERCNDCGKITNDNNYKHDDDTLIHSNHLLGELPFEKNEEGKKCRYCGRYLRKCVVCNNPCYVCIFQSCARSQLTGTQLEYYSNLCHKHAKRANNHWTRGKWVGTSDTNCQTCGTNNSIYKAACACLRSTFRRVHCINCDSDDSVLDRIYCHNCA